MVPPDGSWSASIYSTYDEAARSSFGVWLFDAGGTLLFGQLLFDRNAWITDGTKPYLDVHVEIPEPGGVLFHVEPEGNDLDFARRLGPISIHSGELVLIIGAVAENVFQSGDARFNGSEGVQILDQRAAPGAFLHAEPDFHGLNVHVGGIRSVNIIADASLSESAPRPLYGGFVSEFPLSRLSYDGPDGGAMGETHYAFIGAPPGEYTFNIDRHLAFDAAVWLVGFFADPI